MNDEKLSVLEIGLNCPLVSVVITNYNYSKYIVQCLESVEKQDYPNFNCIIVDDRSTDDSIAKISNFVSSKELKCKFLLKQHEKNMGQMEAFKTGLVEASGVFIAFLDADDILFEDFISTHVKNHLESKIPIAFTSSNQYQIDEKNQLIYCNHPDLISNSETKIISNNIGLNKPWLWATTSSMMFRRAVLQMILPENTSAFRKCADAYIAKFANLLGGSLIIPTVHGCYRRHRSNTFSNNPFIGGILPTGDLRSHPSGTIIRETIISKLMLDFDLFISVLDQNGFFRVIWMVLDNPFEINRLIANYPQAFKNISRKSKTKFRFVFIASGIIRNAGSYFSKIRKGLRIIIEYIR